MLKSAKLTPQRRIRLTRHATRRHYSTPSVPETSDIVIVGGGPAGLALASALGEQSETFRAQMYGSNSLFRIFEIDTKHFESNTR